MTKTEYIEQTRNEFMEIYSDNFPVYVEDETEAFVAMMICRDGGRFLYIIDMASPDRQMNLESVQRQMNIENMSKDEAVSYCNAISKKVFNRPAPNLKDPRVDALESFFEDYNSFCDHCEGQVMAYVSTCEGKSMHLPALEDRLYRIHSLCNRYCHVRMAYINRETELAIIVSLENDDTIREAEFYDIKSNPALLHDFMLEFYRVTE